MKLTLPGLFRIATSMSLLLLPLTRVEADLEDEKPLDLFQKVARAELIVRVKTFDGSLRFALVDVQESLKGSPPGKRLRIAFRDYNFTRKPGSEPIVFPSGQEEILFLLPHEQPRRKERNKEKNKDLFNLYLGEQGRITVPAEGAGAILDAIRRLAAVSSQGPASQLESFGAMLESTNMYLLEASLDEIDRMHAAERGLYGRLSKSLTSPSPGLRVRSLRIIKAIFMSGRDDGQGSEAAVGQADAPDQGPMVLQSVIERARNDSSDEVRAAAVDAMAAWHSWPEVEGDLQAIAKNDPDQGVRYAAERALLRHQTM